MRILKIFVFLLLSAMAVAQKAPLSPSEISGFKKEVAQQAENLHSLSSDFKQTKHIRLMKENSVSKGKLYYKSPNILKWEYQDPYNYIIIFRENHLFINDDGAKSVSNLQSNKLFDKLLSLISGSVNGKLLADPGNFDVTYFKTGNHISAVIVPKDPALKNMFYEIILVFNPQHHVNSVKLMEDQGDFTEIEFSNIKLNIKLDPSVFQN